MPEVQKERHRTGRVGWLRASVLGANDGILSTASLVLGVAAAHAPHGSIMIAGVAGLVAGAMSMAAGEYVSVHSQADTEKADLKLERAELKNDQAGHPRDHHVAVSRMRRRHSQHQTRRRKDPVVGAQDRRAQPAHARAAVPFRLRYRHSSRSALSGWSSVKSKTGYIPPQSDDL